MAGGARTRFGPFLFDRRELRLWRDGSPIDVTPRALGILDALLERPGELISKDELIAKVWPRTVVTDAAVAKRVQELRSALGDDARAPIYLHTLYRRGFKFVGDATPESGAPLVGREAALLQLGRARQSALDGERGVVLLSGEAGIGKTRLLTHFLDTCEVAGMIVASGQCSPYGRDQPYSPLLAALAAIAEAMGKPFEAELRQHAPSWVQLVMAGDDPSTPPFAHNRHMLLLELTALFGALAQRQPVVLALEDIHWSDPSSLIALDALVRPAARTRLLVVATLREGALEPDDPGWRAIASQLGSVRHTQIRLTRFSTADVERYLGTRFDVTTAAQLASTVHGRAEGLPLYVAWLSDWMQDAALSHDRIAPTISLPDSLVRLFELQLTALSNDAFELLETASVIGPEFSIDTLAQVLEKDPHWTDTLLRDVLRSSGMLIPAGNVRSRRFAFTHELLHDTLYRRIEAGRAHALHRRCAQLLRRIHPGDWGEIARHHELAGDPAHAAETRIAAANAALAKHGFEEACRNFEAA
ncbi:MAG: AAA family ATPase, partial [Gammaproteobacteria bacterium]|nr:AAA family ATPase [Gammaproteobacteria bacterium]